VNRSCGCGCESKAVQFVAPSTDADALRPVETQLHGARREPSERQPRWRRVAGWVAPAVPATLLAIMPKCPICFAAYVTLGAGLGLSIQAAAQLRTLLIILCAVSLAYLLARRLRWLVMKWSPHSGAAS